MTPDTMLIKYHTSYELLHDVDADANEILCLLFLEL